jgi:CO dehydrogenase maturation factor
VRIALVGKGGSGKSTVAGTVARLLARQGARVLALDIDPLPGLAFSMGLGSMPEAGLPADLAERRDGQGWVLKDPVTAEELVDRYAISGPDGIRFLQLGKLPNHVKPGSTTAFRHVIDHFAAPGWSMVGDLSAGTRQGFFGWAGFASQLAIVVEPTAAALLTARRLAGLARLREDVRVGLIVNKVRGSRQTASLRTDLPAPVWAVLPYDERIAEVERDGMAPLDALPDSPVIVAIDRLLAGISGERELMR